MRKWASLIILNFFSLIFIPFIGVVNCHASEKVQQEPAPHCSCEDLKELAYSKPNLRGPEIEELQLTLKKLGYYKSEVDGVFGQKTLAAVIDFQREEKIKPTGVVTHGTWHALGNHYEQKAVGKDTPTPPPTGEIEIIIDVTKRTLTIFSDGEPYKQYPCAVGKPETPTPVGNWKVAHKAMHWGTGFGTRWHGLNVAWGIYGIHGTNKPGSIGNYASHGCIRMWNRNVEEIYPWIPKGAPVYIIGNPFGVLNQKDTIVNGSRGADSMLVQKRLKQWGYLKGPVDGVFGYGSEEALKKFQKDFKLRVDGQVNMEDYDALKLR